MTTSDNRPNPFVTVWAQDGLKFETIPESTDDRPNFEGEGKDLHKARATMQEGFPEITMKSAMRGGVPPWGQDHNKILNQITEAIRWMQAGGCAFFNQALCDKIVGYPKGAILQTRAADENLLFLWFSTKDGNKNDPDITTSPDNGWVKLDFKDLEKRLKAAEDHIVVIDGRLDGHDNHLGQIDNMLSDHNTRINTNQSNIAQNANEITNLQQSKAEKNGSCGVSFSADVMQASKYTFCQDNSNSSISSSDDKNALIFNTDSLYEFYIGKNNKEVIQILGGDELTFFNISSEVIGIFSTAGIALRGDTSVQCGNYYTNRSYYKLITKKQTVKKTKTQADGTVVETEEEEDVDVPARSGGEDIALMWSTQVEYFDPLDPITNDEHKELAKGQTKDWLLCCDDAYVILDQNSKPLLKEDKEQIAQKNFIALRVSYQSGDIHAVTGSFVNDPKGDLAEYYQADRDDYEPGTLMCHGIDTEVTLCQSIDQSDNFFGVISTSPAYIMNGKGKDEPNSVLIALNGKVPVKVKGIVKCGDKITIGQDGYGVVSTNKNDVIVGRAKENKVTEDVGLVSCYVQAHM